MKMTITLEITIESHYIIYFRDAQDTGNPNLKSDFNLAHCQKVDILGLRQVSLHRPRDGRYAFVLSDSDCQSHGQLENI